MKNICNTTSSWMKKSITILCPDDLMERKEEEGEKLEVMFH
jgi:hypothetical protein